MSQYGLNQLQLIYGTVHQNVSITWVKIYAGQRAIFYGDTCIFDIYLVQIKMHGFQSEYCSSMKNGQSTQ